jgi:hypothetical protein
MTGEHPCRVSQVASTDLVGAAWIRTDNCGLLLVPCLEAKTVSQIDSETAGPIGCKCLSGMLVINLWLLLLCTMDKAWVVQAHWRQGRSAQQWHCPSI